MTTFADILLAREPTFPALRERIVESQKFQIAPDLLMLVIELGPHAIQDGAQFCRLPFPTSWFEFTTPREMHTRRHKVQTGAICVQRPGSEGRVFEMYCFSGSDDVRPDDVVIGDPLYRDSIGSNPFRLLVDMADPEVIHFDIEPSPHMKPHHLAEFEAVSEKDQEIARQTIMGVAHIVIGTMMFMVAKGGATVERFVHDAPLQRARAKAGKPPLVEFHRLRINLPTPSREPSQPGHGDRTPMRGHTVRGHMMHTRAGGLVFRRPHLRGDFSRGFVVKRYELHADPEALA